MTNHHAMTKNRLWHGLALLSLLSSSGCVRIGLGDKVVIAEQPLEDKRVEVPSRQVHVVVHQDGTLLSVDAERRCDVEKRSRVRNTVEQERLNMSPGITWQLGIYGTILAGVGTGVILDAQLNVADSQLDGQNYNSIGPTGATVIGGAFAGAALPLLIIAMVDGLRATGTEDSSTEAEVSRGFVSRDTSCKVRIPAASATLLGRTRSGTEVRLGNTDALGHLEIDLVEAVESKITLAERARTLSLFIEGHAIGNADLKPVAVAHAEQASENEEKSWGALDVEACEKGSQVECKAVEAFLANHPQSPHAPAARAALAKGAAAERQREAAAQQQRDNQAAANQRAAEEQRRKAEAARVCRDGCSAGCKGNQQCVNACVAAKCK